jgi:hypothetical protein
MQNKEIEIKIFTQLPDDVVSACVGLVSGRQSFYLMLRVCREKERSERSKDSHGRILAVRECLSLIPIGSTGAHSQGRREYRTPST